jgi:polyvinyl alcohol dehydrogenase (cytochrome)
VFDFPGATRTRSQPTIYDDVVYVGSQHGIVYAIDLATGCLHWSFKADAEVRSAISIEPPVKGESLSLFFGDVAGNIYSVGGTDGALLWKAHLNDHPNATITGSPQLYDGRLFVPMSSREWATAADPNYACCTFRGGIAAFDATNGKMLWKNYSIPEKPVDTGKRNPLEVPIIGPSGAPIWNSPTVDSQRGLLYVGTGESYTSPAHGNSDAVLAFKIDTGKLVWSKQLTAHDAWNMSCFIGSSYNCPEENGPDMDIGAPPLLITLASGKDILVVGQKNGFVYGMDPEKEGAILWQRKVGLGGYAGGIHWGMATDGTTVYVPNADTDFIGRFNAERFPGVFALDAATGKELWYTRAEADCREDEKPACDAGVSAAATAVPGLVFAGGFDGQLRAYDSASGKVLWTYQTNRNFTSVAGRQARGGSIESDGPVVYRGQLLVNSGYLFGDRVQGNVLLNFSLPESAVKESQ